MKKLLLLLAIIICAFAKAQYTMLTDFTGNGAFTSANPQMDQNLISDGTFLYGMTDRGGANNLGTIFKILPNGSGYTKLLDFTGTTNGSSPYGSLIFDGTYLYGMTYNGGINDLGTIFKILPNGAGYTKLLDFGGTINGGYPLGSLLSDGTYLYGMTSAGGTGLGGGLGTAFKILPNGTGYVKLLDFSGATNGSIPRGSLISDGIYLYGMTHQGGINGMGTVFKILPNGSGYAKLQDFAGTSNGGYPYGSLISDGTYLYGMTQQGGANSMGTAFKILPNGSGYTKFIDFAGTTNGNNPFGSFISDGTFLYGVTPYGGANSMGTAFKILPNGTGYTKLIDFAGTTNGNNPFGSLMFDGTFLYGMTANGGVNSSAGVIFKIQPNGSGYAKLFDFFGATNGGYPPGSLISDGTFLYGMTNAGGSNNLGTIFKILPNGTGYTKLLDFAGTTNGSSPNGSLIFDGTFLYGMTQQGGANNLGTAFKILPNGTGYIKLLDFDGTTNGSYPLGSLISDNTFLYGMTYQGGANSLGTAFKILPNGTGYAKLLDFDGATNGSYPRSSLVFDGTYLYGMTQQGGANSMGTGFKILPNGTGYNKLLDFSGSTNGSYPCGSLIFDGTFLYGMTTQGGATNEGTAFKILPNGTGYGKLIDFASTTNGSSPNGSLIFDGTFLYGMNQQGGANSMGTAFKILPNGAGFSKFIDFAGTANGNYPNGSLISDGTYLYGMTTSGGSANVGTVFKYQYCNPIIAIATATSVCAGTTITITANGATTYTWSGGVTNGAGFIPASTTIYSVTGSGVGVCANTVTVSVTVNALPTVSVTSGAICAGEAFTITPSGASTYTYSSGSNIVTTNTTVNVTGTSSLGCVSSNTAVSSVTVNALPTVSVTSGSICASQAFTITPSGASTYTYSSGSNIVTTNTIVNVTGTSSLGCVSSNTAVSSVTVNTLPTVSVTSGAICAGQSFTIIPSGASSYSYSSGSNVVTTNTTVNVIGTSSLGCASSNTAISSVTVYALPTMSINSTSSLICVGESATLSVSGANTYTWSTTQISLTISVSPSITTTYTVNGTDNNGCGNFAVISQSVSACLGIETLASSASTNISVYPNPNNGDFTIETEQETNISITNTLGEIILTQKLQQGKNEINVSNQPSGIYFIKNNNRTFKIIKE